MLLQGPSLCRAFLGSYLRARPKAFSRAAGPPGLGLLQCFVSLAPLAPWFFAATHGADGSSGPVHLLLGCPSPLARRAGFAIPPQFHLVSPLKCHPHHCLALLSFFDSCHHFDMLYYLFDVPVLAGNVTVLSTGTVVHSAPLCRTLHSTDID